MGAVIAGIPLIGLIFGLVEFSKKLGLEGKILTIESAVLGLLIGGGYDFLAAPPVLPLDFARVVAVGLAYGLTASGIYDFITKKIA